MTWSVESVVDIAQVPVPLIADDQLVSQTQSPVRLFARISVLSTEGAYHLRWTDTIMGKTRRRYCRCS